MPDRSKVMTQTKRDTLVPLPGWGLGVRLTTSRRKKILLRYLKEMKLDGYHSNDINLLAQELFF
jgi:hypothetical protein